MYNEWANIISLDCTLKRKNVKLLSTTMIEGQDAAILCFLSGSPFLGAGFRPRIGMSAIQRNKSFILVWQKYRFGINYHISSSPVITFTFFIEMSSFITFTFSDSIILTICWIQYVIILLAVVLMNITRSSLIRGVVVFIRRAFTLYWKLNVLTLNLNLVTLLDF